MLAIQVHKFCVFRRLPVREGNMEQLHPPKPDEPHRQTQARQWPQLRGHPPGHTELQEQAGQGEQAKGCVPIFPKWLINNTRLHFANRQIDGEK